MFKPSYENGGSIDLKSLHDVLIFITNNFGIYFVRIIVSFNRTFVRMNLFVVMRRIVTNTLLSIPGNYVR